MTPCAAPGEPEAQAILARLRAALAGPEHEGLRRAFTEWLRRFNASTGERLSALLAGVSEPDRLKAVGDAVVECGTGEEVLAAARRIVGDRTE